MYGLKPIASPVNCTQTEDCVCYNSFATVDLSEGEWESLGQANFTGDE
ncbi:MAG: hypothetical protein HC780_14585 [Leptolyngbyaceae cyanobacterium CSU_1_3]|nr:hypothetical protein [Leptolyngbyaceae cyanobacterium CSU_1_3]